MKLRLSDEAIIGLLKSAIAGEHKPTGAWFPDALAALEEKRDALASLTRELEALREIEAAARESKAKGFGSVRMLAALAAHDLSSVASGKDSAS